MADLARLREPSKRWTYSGIISADGMLTFTDGSSNSSTWMDLGDVDWERIVIDADITTVTGTTTTLSLKLKTANSKTGTQPDATIMAAKDTGGTAITVAAATTAATRTVQALLRYNGTGPATVGRYLGIFADVTLQAGGSYTTKIYVEAGK